MKKILFILLFVSFFTHLFGQGCSDAGFCTISDMDNSFEKPKNTSYIQISEVIGLGEQQTLLFTTQFDLNFQIEKNFFQLRIPYQFIHGNLGNNYGIGDLSLSYSRQIIVDDKTKLNMILGGKVPVSDVNKGFSTALNHLSLPMVYQLGLGTYDLILGLSFIHRNWHVAAAYQHPMGRNENEYAHGNIIDLDIIPTAYLDYNESAGLRRSDDIMLRVERTIKKGEHQFAIGILPIYHIKNDNILIDGIGEEVKNSKGITININTKGNWKLNEYMKLYTQFAFPVIAREKRPDGLTRSLVVSIGLIYNLN